MPSGGDPVAGGKTLAVALTVKVGDRTDSRTVDYRIS